MFFVINPENEICLNILFRKIFFSLKTYLITEMSVTVIRIKAIGLVDYFLNKSDAYNLCSKMTKLLINIRMYDPDVRPKALSFYFIALKP